STNPALFKPSRNAARFLTFVDGVPLLKKAITGICCCAHTTRGSAIAAPTNAMNSRRRIAAPEAQQRVSYRLNLASHARFWAKSRHMQCKHECPLKAKSRPVRHQFKPDFPDFWESPEAWGPVLLFRVNETWVIKRSSFHVQDFGVDRRYR